MRIAGAASLAIALLALASCAAAPETAVREAGAASPIGAAETAKFEQDRRAILAMAGDYRVRFDFTETVSFLDEYRLREPDRSGGYEVVRVIEDLGDFISLQHILVVEAGDETFPVKHWRQDWRYQPASVLIFEGGNAWTNRPVPDSEGAGAWSQQVYLVDDSPRYGAVGRWSHENGVSEWTPSAELRPLPRREATVREDYFAMLAVNRHAITWDGWVHEQDNSKLAMIGGRPRVIAREHGVNTYRRYADFDETVALEYWDATKDFWAAVRAEWTRLETPGASFALTVKGEPEALYTPILELADNIQAGKTTTDAAIADARALIAQFTTRDVAPLDARIAKATPVGESYRQPGGQ